MPKERQAHHQVSDLQVRTLYEVNRIEFQLLRRVSVDEAVARNCTTINPCQQDATIIRDAEITANIVNQCGRTELTGNIDVGENTENALAAGAVTEVKSGSEITVTIHQVNADGAGPYVCDLDETSNTGVISQVSLGFHLSVMSLIVLELDCNKQRPRYEWLFSSQSQRL